MFPATVSLVSVMVSGFFSDWSVSSTGNSLHVPFLLCIFVIA
jgi:hypothetical protein